MKWIVLNPSEKQEDKIKKGRGKHNPPDTSLRRETVIGVSVSEGLKDDEDS